MSNFASNDNMTAIFTAAGEKIGERAKIFPGTKAEWDALPLSEKIKYDYVAFAGDSQSGIVDDVPTEDSENLVKSGGVYDSLATKANLTQISNPNLLDNPWFTVNQRGQSSYSGNGVYTIDRWVLSGGSLTVNVNSDGISLVPSATGTRQLQNRTGLNSELTGKTVTISIMFTDGHIEYTTGVASTNSAINKLLSDGKSSIILYYHPNNLNYYFIIQTTDETALNNIRAVKLELGSVSTLAMDTAPNYTTELLKCQRYFYRYKAPHAGFYFGLAIVWDTNKMSMVLPVPCMRSVASVTASNFSDFLASKGSSAQSPHDISNFVNYGQSEQNHATGLVITTSESDLTSGDIYVLKAVNASAYIDFSADL